MIKIGTFVKPALMLVLLGAIVTGGTTFNPVKAEASVEPLLGEIQLYPYAFTPKGWVKAEGQTMQISQNYELYSLLGTNYGGDGQTTFALPDLRGASPMPGVSYYIAIEGAYPSRN